MAPVAQTAQTAPVAPRTVAPAAAGAPARTSVEDESPAPPRAQALVVPAPRRAAPVPSSAAAPITPVVDGVAAQTTAVRDDDHTARWSAWAQALIDANAVQAMPRELALQAQCLSLVASPTTTQVRLRVEREPLRAAGTVDKLSSALAVWLGHAVSIEVEPGAVDESLALQIMRRREARQREAEATIHNDPLVLQLLQEFRGAHVVPGSVRPI
jgi:DNA polymerase-3 subunit gamma/tau